MNVAAITQSTVPFPEGLTLTALKDPAQPGWSYVRDDELEALRAAFQKVADERDQSNDDVEILRAALDCAKATSELSKEQRERAEASYANLSKDFAQANARIESLESDLAASKGQTTQQTDARKDAEQKAETLASRFRAANESRTRAKSSIDAASEAIEQLASQVEGLADADPAIRETLEKAQENITRVRVSLSKDYTTSGIPSSYSPNHKTIPNSRQKTGRNTGGQPNHEGHWAKMKEAEEVDEFIEVAHEEFAKDPSRYRPTGTVTRAQVFELDPRFIVTEYTSPIFVDTQTGKKVHAPFPDGLRPGVNYGDGVKAMVFMMTNSLNVSVGKTSRFLKDISKGKLSLSEGFIYGLNQEFSEKSEEERLKIWQTIHDADVQHADYTSVRCQVNKEAKRYGILITCDSETGCVEFKATGKKGLAGLVDSPVEDSEHTVVSDGEATFVRHCGRRHQRCLAHINRTLELVLRSEKKATWAKEFKDFIPEAIHLRNTVAEVNHYEPTVEQRREADKLIGRFYEIRDKAIRFYKNGRPLPGFPDGENLTRQLKENPEHFILFLRDFHVPGTNNLAEQGARQVKRKEKQVGTFRSPDGVRRFCDGQTVLLTAIRQGESLFHECRKIFARPSPRWGNTRGPTRKNTALMEEERDRWLREHREEETV